MWAGVLLLWCSVVRDFVDECISVFLVFSAGSINWYCYFQRRVICGQSKRNDLWNVLHEIQWLEARDILSPALQLGSCKRNFVQEILFRVPTVESGLRATHQCCSVCCPVILLLEVSPSTEYVSSWSVVGRSVFSIVAVHSWMTPKRTL